MIDIFNFETAYKYGDALPTLLKCRYREFVLQHKYEVPTYNGMEYDQYDTPAAIYLIWRDVSGTIRAGMRLLPTSRPYMIQELWPQTVKEIDLPQKPTVWEATRFFIDKSIDKNLRHLAHAEILCGMLEFALHYGIAKFIATAPPRLWDFTFRRFGWPAIIVGPSTEIGYSELIQTCMMDVTSEILETVRLTANINDNVINHSVILRDRDILVDNNLLPGVITDTGQFMATRGEESCRTASITHFTLG